MNFDDTERRYGYLNKNRHFLKNVDSKKRLSSLNQNFSSILKALLFNINLDIIDKMLIFKKIAITPFSIIKIQNVGGVLENSGNLQQDGHKNFEN